MNLGLFRGEYRVQPLPPNGRRGGLFALSLLSFVAAVVATLFPRPTTLELVATTEVAEMTTSDELTTLWYLTSVQPTTDGTTISPSVSGQFEIAPKVRIIVERIGNGPLLIRLGTVDNKSGHLGSIHKDDGSTLEINGRSTEIIVADLSKRSQNGQNLVLPISGKMRIGAAIEAPVSGKSPLLREGKIAPIGRNFLGSDLYRGDTQTLAPGDVIFFERSKGSAVGVLVIDEKPAMTASIHVFANEAVINRYPASGYTIGISLIDRIQKDGTLQKVWTAFFFLLGLRKLGE
jgi:hypothetical protein